MEPFIYLILGALIGGLVGFMFGKQHSSDQNKLDEMEKTILEKDKALQDYKEKVGQHFEQTAQLFNNVTKEYQSLYQHLAQNAAQLTSNQPFLESHQQVSSLENLSNQPSTSSDENENTNETFSDESLYKAFEYRNQSIEDTPTTQPSHSNENVVQLDVHEETKQQPPLDYADKSQNSKKPLDS